MKLQGKAVEGFLARPDARVRAVLVFGPDAGLVRERADRLARTVVTDLADPFRVAELPVKAVASDAARLVDEMAAQALTGGRRLVRMRGGDDSLAESFAALFAAPSAGDSLAVVEAGELGPRSRLRLAFEGAPNAAALPCYNEDEAALRPVLTELAAAQGVTLEPDALEYLAPQLVGDRLIARSEIEKLALYLGAQPGSSRKRCTLEDAQAAVGDSASLLELDDPAWAAASGDYAGLDRALGRLFAESMAPVAILRATQRHFLRLHAVQAEIANGTSAESAVGAMRPPLFFKLKTQFAAQLRQWPRPALRQALERLTEAEIECKRTGIPDEAVCARTLLQLAALARRR